MHATVAWEAAAFLFASGISILLVLLAVILIHANGAARRREELLRHDRAKLTAANCELEVAKARADEKAAQLEATLAGITDGVSMVDADLCLMEWNPRFPEIAGVPASMLRVGLPMEEVLRAQAAAGQFGVVDIEAEVARRIAHLRSGDVAGTTDRKSTRLNSSHYSRSRMPSSA